MKGVQRLTCLVCCGDITTQPGSKKYVQKKSTITKHLDVIFILKYIFELPSDQLSLYLRNCPNIEQWITICDTCDELIDSFKAIYHDLLDVERMFRATKQRIVDMAKHSYNNLRVDRFQSEEDDELDIMDGCRCFISQHHYTGSSNPFAEGDAKAQDLLDKNSGRVGEEDFDEFLNFDDFNDCDDDDDADWKPNNPIQPKEVVQILSTKKIAIRKTKLSSRKQKNFARVRKTKHKNLDTNSGSDVNTSSYNDDNFEAEFQPANNSEMEESPDEFGCKSKIKSSKKEGNKMIIKRIWDGTRYLINCPTCGKRLNKYKLARHNRIHGAHQCDLCPNNFRTPSLLHTHRIQVHNMSSSKPEKNQDGSVTCTEPNCNMAVSSYKELERHFRMEHKEAPKLSCKKCDAKFYTRNRYHNHRSRHKSKLSTREKSVTCEHCGAAFITIGQLNYHKMNTLRCKLLYQTKAEATVVCDQCGGSFAAEANLQEHIKRVHNEGAKRDKDKFNCDLCGAKFELKTHWKLHLFEAHQIIADNKGSKKNFYKCPVPGCDNVFRENKRLQNHLSKHRGDPQYECDECRKMFYFPDNLNAHKMTVHSKQRVKCDICKREYSSKLYLQRHKCVIKNDEDMI